jgi:excisionase family DNA binding protein
MLKPVIADYGKHDIEDTLMTIDEAAKFLNLHKKSGQLNREQIYQWVNNSQHGLGSFPYHKAGKLLRFSKTEILKWMKGNSKRLESR